MQSLTAHADYLHLRGSIPSGALLILVDHGYAPTFAAMAGLSYITGYGDWPPSNFMGSIDLNRLPARKPDLMGQ
jgi:hypothetical protein